jgi:hypothetical protein
MSRFYYSDERLADGSPAMMARSGEAQAAECVKLVERKEQGRWHHTFVKGTGYIDFYDADRKDFFT